jgi:hypothetical protein
MKIKNIFLNTLAAGICIVVVSACQKMSKPALPANYPTDNPVTPTTPLRFYLPFDSTSAEDAKLNIRFKDSISSYPSFFPPPSIKYTAGVRGTAYQGSLDGYIHYFNANDFAKSTSFTISFWLKATLAQKDHNNADGVLALADTTNFWSPVVIYTDHESSTSDSMILKFHFLNGNSDVWDFAGYAGTSRFPHMYDGQWHMVTFVYDAAAKTGTVYRDGVQFDKKTNISIAFTPNHITQLVVGGFQQAIGAQGTYAQNTWMSGFPGALDNIRLYNTALSATDIQNLYANKL